MPLIHTISLLFRCSSCAIRAYSICSGMTGPQALEALAAARSAYRSFRPCDPIYAQGDDVSEVFIVLSGWVQLYQILEDGRRQIQRFLMPGDMFGTVSTKRREIDHSAEVLTQATVCIVPSTRVSRLRQQFPPFGDRVLEAVEHHAHMSMDMVTNLGRRNATERIAWLLNDCLNRMRQRGLIAPDAVRARLPLTQVTIGDALGLTSIHVNRVLRSLREMNVLTFGRGTLIVHDDVKFSRLVHGCGGSEHRDSHSGDRAVAQMVTLNLASHQQCGSL